MNAILQMLHGHWFWGLLTLAVLIWYSTITVYVAIRGTLDIKQMLRQLEHRRNSAGQAPPDRNER